jgi:hypothetical protein
MNFKEATDALFERVTHDDLASELGVSVPSIRQARLDSKAEAFRQPPDGWEGGVRKLAEARAKHYEQLARKVKGT